MICPAQQIGRTLLGRYRVKRHRGQSGEGTMFLAEPVNQDRQPVPINPFEDRAERNERTRDVVLEVIPHASAYDPRRVEELGAIQPHPHILRFQETAVIDDEDLAGARCVVWEAWDETLTGLLSRRGTLELKHVLTIAKEIAAALARYHAERLVHGEVRADRICLVEGHWKLAPSFHNKNHDPAELAEMPTSQDDVYSLGLVLLRCLSRRFTAARNGSPTKSAVRVEINQALGELTDLSQHWLGRCLAEDEKERWSAAELALIGHEIPRPVEGVSVDRTGSWYRIQWKPTDRGQVGLYRWSRGKCPAKGEVWLVTEIDRVAEKVPLSAPTTADVQMQPSTTCQVSVATILGKSAVIGESITLSWAADVQRLKLTIERGSIAATWDWPEGAPVARVLVKLGDFATGRDDGRARKEVCYRPGYMPEGRFLIPIKEEVGVVHVTVYAVHRHEDGWEFACGITRGARATINVSHCVRPRLKTAKPPRSARFRFW